MKNERIIRCVLTAICECIAVGVLIAVIPTRRITRILLAAVTILLLLIPEEIERVMGYRISLPLYVFLLVYILGIMLGECVDFYERISGWDKLMHTMGGVTFALVGYYLYEFLGGDPENRLLQCVTALLLSVTLSVLWEFFEFGADRLLGTDMQRDTVVTGISSYFFGTEMGQVGTLQGIETVSVNGVVLPVSGYLDIGLYDTMLDMLVETIGALAATVWLYLDRKHLPLRFDGISMKKTKKDSIMCRGEVT